MCYYIFKIKPLYQLCFLFLCIINVQAEELTFEIEGEKFSLPIIGNAQINFATGDIIVKFNGEDSKVKKMTSALRNQVLIIKKSNNYLHDQNEILEKNSQLIRNSYLYILVNSSVQSIKTNVNNEIDSLIINLTEIKSGFCQLPRDIFFSPENIKCNDINQKNDIEFLSKGEVIEYIFSLQNKLNTLESNIFNLKSLITHVQDNTSVDNKENNFLQNESFVLDGFNANVSYYKELIRDLKLDLNIELTIKNGIKADLELLQNKYNKEKTQNKSLKGELSNEVNFSNLLLFIFFAIPVALVITYISTLYFRKGIKNTKITKKFLKNNIKELSKKLKFINYFRLFVIVFTSLTLSGFLFKQLVISNIQLKDISLLFTVLGLLVSIPYYVHKEYLVTKSEHEDAIRDLESHS